MPFIITLSYWFVRFSQKTCHLFKNCKNILLLGMISWNIYWASFLWNEKCKYFFTGLYASVHVRRNEGKILAGLGTYDREAGRWYSGNNGPRFFLFVRPCFWLAVPIFLAIQKRAHCCLEGIGFCHPSLLVKSDHKNTKKQGHEHSKTTNS